MSLNTSSKSANLKAAVPGDRSTDCPCLSFFTPVPPSCLCQSGCDSVSHDFPLSGASLAAQMVKNLPAVREMQVRSLGWEGPLEKGQATHSSILAWRIPWTEEPGGLQSTGSQRVGHD